MNETPAQTLIHIDDAGRERVRQALMRYMAEHRIGTPTLQVRIIEADQPRHREIPLSTLQRFLKGSHQTQEHHVMLCHDFVKELPYFAEGHDIRVIGDDLAAFLLVPKEGFDKALRRQAHEHSLSGTYDLMGLRTHTEETPIGTRRTQIPDIPYGHITFRPYPTGSFLLANETVVNQDLVDGFKEVAGQPRYTYEGVYVHLEPRAFVLLRQTLTRLPKTYLIYPGTTDPNVYAMGQEFRSPFSVFDTLRPGVRVNIERTLTLIPRLSGRSQR